MGDLFPNYLLEFAMLLPAAVIALAPLRGNFRFREGAVYIAAFGCIVAFCVVGALAASSLEVPTNYILIPECLVMFALLMYVSALDRMKTAFCFLNAAALCAFSAMYSFYLVAPWELGNNSSVFTLKSGGVCLFVTFVLCALFAWTLLVKLPALFGNKILDSMWKWVVAAALVLVAFIIWITPVSAINIMVGYFRPKALALFLIFPAAIWLVHHVAWIISSRISESEQLKRENELLKLEEKRHDELLSFIEDARAMRHDFRHHMAVVGELAQGGKVDEVVAYADQFVEASRKAHSNLYCENSAVDAIAAHYDALAESRGVNVTWTLDLPGELPVKEVDFCSVLGNLVENAIIAAGKCEGAEAVANVKAGTFAGNIITLVVENGYAEPLSLAEDGLPQSNREGHSVGLTSVAAIARRYNGSLTISTEGSTFSATVVLYAG